MRPFFHLSDTDSTLGMARVELEQKIEAASRAPSDSARFQELEKRIAILEAEVIALKRRTWWSMLKDLFLGN